MPAAAHDRLEAQTAPIWFGSRSADFLDRPFFGQANRRSPDQQRWSRVPSRSSQDQPRGCDPCNDPADARQRGQ